MLTFSTAVSRPLSSLLRAFAAAALLSLTGCATHYVDGSLKEVPQAAFTKPAQPVPVQLVFEFQTKGAVNARATEVIKPLVVDSVKSTGLFSAIEDKPVPEGALLSIKINNVPLTDDAFSKGFVTGLTFGAAGSQVTDGYVCTVQYLAAGASGRTVTRMGRHAIHTTVGNSAAPANATKAASIDEAVRTMVRQVVSNVLNDVSKDAAFAAAR